MTEMIIRERFAIGECPAGLVAVGGSTARNGCATKTVEIKLVRRVSRWL